MWSQTCFQPFSCKMSTSLLGRTHTLQIQEENAVRLVKNWRGPAAVWLSFGANSFTDKLTPARSLLETLYAYEPVAAKASSLSLRTMQRKAHENCPRL